MSSNQIPERSFDLTPHPRILPMLGEIVLPQWRCLAEFIDNSVDAFLEASRAGAPVERPCVSINVPMTSSQGSVITARDNGRGMDADTLERAARAGWTSHDPINNLGLFGMGFNIATARLGSQTTIWSTRRGDPEWVGLEINFEHLNQQQAFVTPAKTRPKSDPNAAGTEVVVERLKPEQRDWFSRAHNRSLVKRHLGRIYSAMLLEGGSPISFRLELNGNQIRPRLHCVWGGAGNSVRSVETARYGTVDAFQSIDVSLTPRPFCQQCWNWLVPGQASCPFCESSHAVVSRERHVHGWLGIQRYLDKTEFGVDLLRNGRKIEIGIKALFVWFNEQTDSEEIEYPIDDPRGRGRIVGEIHLDHCRVPYTKDRFVREDTAWQEMVQIVRGIGPLRPDIAQRLGVGENNSPLYRLFQAFRRSSPHNKRMAGGWRRILVVSDNNLASEMAKRFYAGENDYQSDEKWWELIDEQEGELLTSSGDTGGDGGNDTLGGDDTEGVEDTLGGKPGGDGGEQTPDTTTATPPLRTRIPSLCQQYSDETTQQRFNVEAFSVSDDDPDLGDATVPWTLRRTTAGPWQFHVNITHSVFQSITLTPLDALLTQIAFQIIDFERNHGTDVTFAKVLTGLRSRYASAAQLVPATLIAEAGARLIEIARSITEQLGSQENQSLYEELPPSTCDVIQIAMASRGVASPQGAIEDGRFLQYASPQTIVGFVQSHPEMFFDGRLWDDAYSALPYTNAAALEAAQARVLSYYSGLLTDVAWLADSDPDDLQATSRERLMRAALATEMLAPNIDEEELS